MGTPYVLVLVIYRTWCAGVRACVGECRKGEREEEPEGGDYCVGGDITEVRVTQLITKTGDANKIRKK